MLFLHFNAPMQDPQGQLWDAVLDGAPEGVKAALEAGACLNGPEGSFEAITSRWPLHAAAANNHLDVARLLVEQGADVDKLDAVSEPALWHAVEQVGLAAELLWGQGIAQAAAACCR